MTINRNIKDVKVKEGETAEFICELSKPDYKVSWQHADYTIPLDDDRYRVENDGNTYKLIIPETTADMLSEVTLIAGDNKSTAQLTVIGW